MAVTEAHSLVPLVAVAAVLLARLLAVPLAVTPLLRRCTVAGRAPEPVVLVRLLSPTLRLKAAKGVRVRQCRASRRPGTSRVVAVAVATPVLH